MKIKFPLAAALSLADEMMLPSGHNLGAACVKWQIAGSIRRKKPLVSDIEIIFIPRLRAVPPPQLELGMDDLPSIPLMVSLMDERLNELMRKGILAMRKSSSGSTMCGPLVKLLVHVPTEIPIDFFACTLPTWTTTLVCRTGGKDSNTELAGRANRLGFTWNPGGVGFTRLSDGVEFPISTEEEAFRFVGLPFLPPEKGRRNLYLDFEEGIVRDMSELVFVIFSRHDVETRNFSALLSFWGKSELPSEKELAGLMGTFIFSVGGYDDITDELYAIQDVRDFYAALHKQWPYWLFFCNLENESLKMITSCLMQNVAAKAIIGAPGASVALDQLEVLDFIYAGFTPMNEMTERAGLSQLDNWKRTKAIVEYFGLPFDAPPPR